MHLQDRVKPAVHTAAQGLTDGGGVYAEACTGFLACHDYHQRSLLSGSCRVHAGGAEEDMKILQQRDLTAEERLAARLRLAEKRVLQSTLDAVRRCSDVPLQICFSARSFVYDFAMLTAA